MKVPKFNWIPFDKNDPPCDLDGQVWYLVLLREDNYDDGATWRYSVDYAQPYGDYVDDFWNTCNDWREGQRVEILAYADLPYSLKEEDLEDADEHI